MNRNGYIFCLLVLTLAGLGGCSSEPAVQESKKAGAAPDRIQGKVQVNLAETTADDAALNAGGQSVYLWEGVRRYRLFFKTAVQIDPGKEYIAEGVYAQKAIDEIGDPDQGKNGYPLESSCQRVVRTAWPNLAFDDFDATVSLVCGVVKRYPARALFLVTRIRPLTSSEGSAVAEAPKKDDANAREVPVPADKQRASLIQGPTVEPAPLWNPAGGTVHCKVIIDPEGKVSELQTGAQLCESVPWSEFSYKPLVQSGHPVKVSTEVEVRFEARK
jgi:hypothetical protein